MKIREIIWLREFADKIEVKHHVSQDEVDETLENHPRVRRMDVEQEREKISIAQWARPLRAGTCQFFSFTKGKDEH